MVRLPLGYCIDSTEVTQRQYQTWLDTNPSTENQTSVCSWNSSFVPTFGWPPTGAAEYPVTSVDWCDAYAYCLGVGKRLCGVIPSERVDGVRGQWSEACTSGELNEYPYGSIYQPRSCNGYDAGNGGVVPVGTMPSCQSSVAGYQGVYDLSGNVAEWIDYCDSPSVSGNQNTPCVAAGGDHTYDIVDSAEFRLRCASGKWLDRNAAGGSVGFRCCAD